MKRRSFLAMLGLAPVVSSAAAVTVQDVAAEPVAIQWGAIERAWVDNLQTSIDEQMDWTSKGVRDLIEDARAMVASHI